MVAGAVDEKDFGVSPNLCQNVLFDGSLPLQSMVPKCTCDITDMRFDAPKNPPPIVTFSLAHCSIQGSPPKKTCAHPLFCQRPGTGQARWQLRAVQARPDGSYARCGKASVGRLCNPARGPSPAAWPRSTTRATRCRRRWRSQWEGWAGRGWRAKGEGEGARGGRVRGTGGARELRGRASLSCAASSSSTVAMVAREMVTSEYRHMQPMIKPPKPKPYFQLAALISSARFRSASRSALVAFFSANIWVLDPPTSGSLFGLPAFRADITRAARGTCGSWL